MTKGSRFVNSVSSALTRRNVLVVAAVVLLAVVGWRMMLYLRQNEPLDQVAARAMRVLLSGDSSSLANMANEEELKLIGANRDSLVRLLAWSDSILKGAEAVGPMTFRPLRNGEGITGTQSVKTPGGSLIALDVEIHRLGDRTVLAATEIVQNALRYKYWEAAGDLPDEVRATSAHLAGLKAELPTLQKFSKGLSSTAIDGKLRTWDRLIIGNEVILIAKKQPERRWTSEELDALAVQIGARYGKAGSN